MRDKAREEFQARFPKPLCVNWSEDRRRYVSRMDGDKAAVGIAAEYNVAHDAWLAAKEKYEPRWIPVGEILPEIDQYVVWSCDDGYMIFAERDKDDPDGYWEERFTHWAVINPPSTQGGRE